MGGRGPGARSFTAEEQITWRGADQEGTTIIWCYCLICLICLLQLLDQLDMLTVRLFLLRFPGQHLTKSCARQHQLELQMMVVLIRRGGPGRGSTRPRPVRGDLGGASRSG